MYMHERAVHGIGNVKTYQCDVCFMIFKYKQHLEKHVATPSACSKVCSANVIKHAPVSLIEDYVFN